MTNEKMEQRLASALEKTAPDDMSGVLSRCEARKGTVIPMTTKKTTKKRWTTLAAACLALVLGGALSETASFFLQIFSYVRDKRALTGGGMPVPFREVARISLPVALSAYVRSGLVTVEHVLIPVGLTAFGDANALATYGVISAVALPVVLYPTAFVGAFSSLIIPEVTEFDAKENRREVAYVTSRAFSVTLFCAVPAAGFFGAFAADICRVVYGDTAAADYLRMLAPLMPVMFLDTVTDSILKGLGKQFYTMCVNIADAAVSVLLVAVLVPKMGLSTCSRCLPRKR